MEGSMKFDYYYGTQAEQFSFYRVPKLLIKDKRFRRLSSDAKLLYGLMLDRMSLSVKNGWFDEENRAYIHYKIESIMEDLGCAKATCIKILSELDSRKGIGLIEKKRRGLGKPDIIYVKNFVVMEPSKEEEPTADNRVNRDISEEIQKTDWQKEENQDSRSSETVLLEMPKANLQKDKKQNVKRAEMESPQMQGEGFYEDRNPSFGGSEGKLPEVQKLYFRKFRN